MVMVMMMIIKLLNECYIRIYLFYLLFLWLSFLGDSIHHEVQAVGCGGGLPVCQAEEKLHSAKPWFHATTDHLPGNS